MKLRCVFTILLCFISLFVSSQNEFHFNTANKKKVQISFKLINNLIVIPLEVNGQNLSFILDTGVNKTILFYPSEKDSLNFSTSNSTQLRGLGKDKDINAYISENNIVKIKDIINFNEVIYVTPNSSFDFSKSMGVTIHGIIGYSLFKNFVIKINYTSQRITFYKSNSYQYKNCRNCVTKPMIFSKNKPYINTQISLDTIGHKLTEVKLLIDTGGSDTMWLFENAKKRIITPKRFFNDILGESITGHIYGNRSRINKLLLGHLEIKNPTVSFLDSTSIFITNKFKTRNGSIGGKILRRFTIWFDYSNKIVTLKKNKDFSHEFNYNMSGLHVVYNGLKIIRQAEFENSEKNINSSNPQYKYTYQFKPSYVVDQIVPNSPADKAGLLEGDIIYKINNKHSYQFDIEQIFYKLQEKDQKKIKITVDRNDKKIEFTFKLEKYI